MKLLAVLCLFALGALSAPERDGDIYEMFDTKMILENEEVRTKVFACLMDRGPCEEYQPIRERGPRIIKTKCEDCTAKQKQMYEASVKFMEDSYSDAYKDMVAKYA